MLVDAEVSAVLARLETLMLRRQAGVAWLERTETDRAAAARYVQTTAAEVEALLDDLAALVDVQAQIAAHRAHLGDADLHAAGAAPPAAGNAGHDGRRRAIG
jgi:hypothetical protein